ncbi:hypothetical protein JCM10213_004786 [Rhodosporidiobolus nylandii]
MSSFDQSRGYSVPSGFTRSNPGWHASDGWATSASPSAAPPPLPTPSALFAPADQPLTSAHSRLDYSLIDQDDFPANGGAGAQNGFSRGAGFGANLLDGSKADEPWQLKRQTRITVVLQPDLEGFVMKHNVWQVISGNGHSVSRRYSDFVWLLDVLVRRYPFRLLPSLPPKRLQVSGHYLATDDLFLERRRRGLERALTALTHHPVVRHDGVLRVFLEEQGDLTLWRKHNPLSLSEESTTRVLTPAEEASLPSDLASRLSTLRERLPALVEAWTRIVSHSERLAHRRLNQGGEFAKMLQALEDALAVERECPRQKEALQADRETAAVAKTMGAVGETEEQSARRKLDGFVEEVKRHRELYTNMRDLFHRQTTLGVDNVDKLKKRVETNLSKMALLRTHPPADAAQQAEKLAAAIESDQREIDALLRRRAFVRWCVWEEVEWVGRNTSLLSLALKDYASDETSYARRLAEQWSALSEALGAAE